MSTLKRPAAKKFCLENYGGYIWRITICSSLMRLLYQPRSTVSNFQASEKHVWVPLYLERPTHCSRRRWQE